MTEEQRRFDLIFDERGCRIDYHFCREIDGDTGCYGTNPDHGFSFEDAREQLASWHEEKAKRIRETSYDDWEQTGNFY